MPSTGSILIITDSDSVHDAHRLGRDLEAHWCGGPFPGAKVLHAGGIDSDPDVSRFSLVLIVGGRGTIPFPNTSGIDRTIHLSIQHEIPVVLIGHEGDASSHGLPGQVLTFPDSRTPEALAPFLAGITRRNQRLETITQEHELTQRLVGNIHREIGQIDEELQSASIVQREFMPKSMPSLGTVSTSVLWRPSSYVSGDFYQAVQIDERRIGMLLVDAAGHGVGSALMTIVMARAFNPVDEEGGCSPGAVLQRINQALVQIQGGRMQFATGIYIVLDCFDGSISYACAGHPAPFLLDERSMEPLGTEGAGPALGIFEDADYEVMHGRLNEAQSILLYSDGFEHAFPLPNSDVTNLQSPNNAYMNVFKSLSDLGTTQQMVDRIEQVIDGRRGSLQPYDDLTLLCVRRARVTSGIEQAA